MTYRYIAKPGTADVDITGEHAYIHQLALRDEILTSPPPSMSRVNSPAPATIPVAPHPQLKAHSVTTVRKKQPRSAEVVEILGTDSDSDSPVIVSAASHQWQLKCLAKSKLEVLMLMKTWPSGFSVAEISNGFCDIEALAAQQNYTVKMAFEKVFKVSYVNGTYYGHLQRWKRATQDSRNTAHGSWSDFMKIAHAPDADIKAARK